MKPTSKILILGAAESGVGAALLAAKEGHEVLVSDAGTIKGNFRTELLSAGIRFEENGHQDAYVFDATTVVKSPGIPDHAKIVGELKAKNYEIISEIEFAYRYKKDSKIVAITGSNGKSTTTKMVNHIFSKAGLDVSLVGNIGISFARQVATRPTAWYAVEVSSFQLDGISSFRPDIAVILNINPDHLDRYNYDFGLYTQSKFNISRHQTTEDFLILNQDDLNINNYLLNHNLNAQQIFITMSDANTRTTGGFISEDDLHLKYNEDDLKISIHELSLKGKHNQFNSMAAGISARVAGIRKEKIRESLIAFHGLEHRLESVATVRGVEFINDSKATNVNSVWFALESMKVPTILILGGQDKGNDYNEIMELVKEKVKAIVCLGIDNEPIKNAFSPLSIPIVETQEMIDTVQKSFALANTGDAVLLSPACASFDLFKNYEDRGNQFKAAVKSI